MAVNLWSSEDKTRQHIEILSCLPFDAKERFYFGSIDTGHPFFESLLGPKDFDNGLEIHSAVCLNSFLPPFSRRHRRRMERYLRRINVLVLDIDGCDSPFPLSSLDIRSWCRELGLREPSLIIRTSEGRFHVVWRLQSLWAFSRKLSYWRKCAEGLARLFTSFSCNVDVEASTNPIGFIRLPGHPNYKYAEKPIVEVVFQSDSIFMLSEIHEVLIDNGVARRAKQKTHKKNIHEKIRILESGVPHGIGNFTCLTLAIHYREEGLPPEEALRKLLDWNSRLEQPDPEYKVKNSVKSAYKNGYGLSVKWLDKLVLIASGEIQTTTERKSFRKPDKPRDRIKNYSQKIYSFIESKNGCVTISQRSLAKQLGIPFRSFSHALKEIPGLQFTTRGKGRAAKTMFHLIQQKRLKPVYLPKNDTEEMTQINDANSLCITEKYGG